MYKSSLVNIDEKIIHSSSIMQDVLFMNYFFEHLKVHFTTIYEKLLVSDTWYG